MKIIMSEPYEFQNTDQTLEMPDGYLVRPGLHKHGYYISLTTREQELLNRSGYQLITNLFYSPGDFYEILDQRGVVVDPMYLGKILEDLER